MDQPPRRSRYFEVEAPARPLRKRPRPGETARLEALRSYLAARGVARAEDVLRWTVEVKRRAGGRSENARGRTDAGVEGLADTPAGGKAWPAVAGRKIWKIACDLSN